MIRLVAILYAILTLASTTTVRAQESVQNCRFDEARSSELEKAARGIFSSLVFIEEPHYIGDLGFRDAKGSPLTLAQFEGEFLLLNLWAMWCAPCRAEMADLAQLAKKSGDENFKILAINLDRDGVENSRVYEFLDEVGAANLALYRDEEMKIFKHIRQTVPVRGLPFTLLLDRQGCTIASFAGAAPWGNEDAVYLIETLKK